MKNSIEEELKLYIQDLKDNNVLNEDNREDWHCIAFKEENYLEGCNIANKWLEKHELDVFDTVNIVKEYEEERFGDFATDLNSEAIVNMIVYIYGEELINN